MKIYHILILIIFVSCKKEVEVSPAVKRSGKKVYILSEGNFMRSNGSLSVYYPDEGEMELDVFKSAEGIPLGDVPQSIYIEGSHAYIIVNNSQLLIDFDLSSHTMLGQISGFESPRYMQPFGAEQALVTDIYSNSLYTVNLKSQTIESKIKVNGWCEEILHHEDLLFISNRAQDKVLVVDWKKNALVDSIQVSRGPNSLLLDAQNNLMVLCDGGYANRDVAALYKISSLNYDVLMRLNFQNPSDYPTKLVKSQDGSTFYYLNESVFKLESGETQASVFLNGVGHNFYGLDVDPFTNEVYVSDAKSYTNASEIFRLQADGSIVDTLTAGINASEFAFYQE